MGHREELLAAARRLLQERGYAHITARDLVAESGTNLASIGYHFGSKAALLNAAIEVSFTEWSDQLATIVMADPSATPMERAAATWVSALDTIPDHGPLFAAYIEALAQAQRVPELRAQLAAHYSRARTRVAGLVAASLHDGTPADDPRCRAIASLVMAACDGLALQMVLDPEGAPTGSELMAGLLTVWTASATAGDLAHGRAHVGEVDGRDDGGDQGDRAGGI